MTEPCFGTGLSLSLTCQPTSEDIKHHFIIITPSRPHRWQTEEGRCGELRHSARLPATRARRSLNRFASCLYPRSGQGLLPGSSCLVPLSGQTLLPTRSTCLVPLSRLVSPARPVYLHACSDRQNTFFRSTCMPVATGTTLLSCLLACLL